MLRGSASSWRSAIEAALARKPRRLPLEEAAIPVVEALGRQGASPLQTTSDRGGAIPIATAEPLPERLAWPLQRQRATPRQGWC